MTFVDGLGVGDVRDVAIRDRRRLSEDGVVIVVATLASQNGGATSPPELIVRGVGDAQPILDELRDRGRPGAARLPGAETSPRSSSCRSTCTTASASCSTTARAGGR